MNRIKLTSAVLCTAMLLCLAACSQPELEPVQSDMTSGTAAAETSSERIHSETNDSSLSEPVQTAENSSTDSADSTSKANTSAALSASTASSRPKPPTASSAPQNPPSSSSAPPAAESSAPQELDEPEPEPEQPEERDPYAYPFDIEAIRQDLIAYGESLGMKHRTHYSDGTEVTPDNGSWELPTYISKDSTAWIIKKALYEQLDYHCNVYKAEVFTIYIESYGNSEYQIYSIYA